MSITWSQTISDSGEINSLTYLCFKAYSIVNLLLGLKHIVFLMKSKASGLASEKKLYNDFFFVMLIPYKIFAATVLSKESRSF